MGYPMEITAIDTIDRLIEPESCRYIKYNTTNIVYSMPMIMDDMLYMNERAPNQADINKPNMESKQIIGLIRSRKMG
jgi:hypothetical protein